VCVGGSQLREDRQGLDVLGGGGMDSGSTSVSISASAITGVTVWVAGFELARAEVDKSSGLSPTTLSRWAEAG